MILKYKKDLGSLVEEGIKSKTKNYAALIFSYFHKSPTSRLVKPARKMVVVYFGAVQDIESFIEVDVCGAGRFGASPSGCHSFLNYIFLIICMTGQKIHLLPVH